MKLLKVKWNGKKYFVDKKWWNGGDETITLRTKTENAYERKDNSNTPIKHEDGRDIFDYTWFTVPKSEVAVVE